MLPPPPPTELPVLRKVTDAYKLWHAHHSSMPKLSRYTLGATIDTAFCEMIDLLLQAGYTGREHKYAAVGRVAAKFDTLKFFIQVAWEIKALEHKQHAALLLPLSEVGKMIGGWRKQLQQNEPPR